MQQELPHIVLILSELKDSNLGEGNSGDGRERLQDQKKRSKYCGSRTYPTLLTLLIIDVAVLPTTENPVSIPSISTSLISGLGSPVASVGPGPGVRGGPGEAPRVPPEPEPPLSSLGVFIRKSPDPKSETRLMGELSVINLDVIEGLYGEDGVVRADDGSFRK